jgi:hypothetical protein
MAIKKFYKKTEAKKKIPTMDELFLNEEIHLGNKEYIPYLIFVFEDIYLRYEIRYTDIMLLLYLSELVVFDYEIEIIENRHNVKPLLDLRFVKIKYVGIKKRYELTEKGYEVVKTFKESLLNKSIYLCKNRIKDVNMDIETKMKNLLSRSLNIF